MARVCLPVQRVAASVASFADVARYALAMPHAVENTGSDGLRSWAIGRSTFVWERPLRKSDLAALGSAAPTGPILGVYVVDLEEKQALLSSKPRFCFTTPHFDGYRAVLVRLDKIGSRALQELITDAWLARAPKRAAAAYLAGN